MSSLADALASLESANACIDAIAGSYPRAFPNDRTSRPIDLTSETARVRREQQTLQRAMTSENDAPVSTSRREKNFYVAPGGVLVNAALVPEPEPAPKRKEPRRDPPPRASHPPNARARLGNETHSAEARAVQWLRDKVVPLLPKQHDPKAVFGRTALGLRTFLLDRDDDEAAREKDAPESVAPESVGGFHVVDATGASVLRVLLEVREVPSAEGPGTDAAYGPSRPERWGREQWTFSRVNRAARLPGPCVVLLMGADGAARHAADEAYLYTSGGNEDASTTLNRSARIADAERNAYVAWCVPKENALALRDVLKKYVVVSRRDATCKWRAFRVVFDERGGTAAEALASTLARHIDASVASRGQSVALDVPLPGFLRIKSTNERGFGLTSELEPARRRGALLDALGTWSHPISEQPEQPLKQPPGSAAPAMAPAWDGLPSATAGSVAALRLDYDLQTSFRVMHLSAVVQAEASWDIAAVTLRKPGRAPTSSFYRNARAGGFGAPYESTDFDVLFVHVGQASRAVGCFVIPVSDLVARLHVLGEFERRGKTYACDASTIEPEVRLMVPTAASRWRGVAPKAPRGDAGVTRGQFVDARGAWALDFFVAYPASRDDVAGAVDEVKRLLLGTKPRWDGEWTHPAFRR